MERWRRGLNLWRLWSKLTFWALATFDRTSTVDAPWAMVQMKLTVISSSCPRKSTPKPSHGQLGQVEGRLQHDRPIPCPSPVWIMTPTPSGQKSAAAESPVVDCLHQRSHTPTTAKYLPPHQMCAATLFFCMMTPVLFRDDGSLSCGGVVGLSSKSRERTAGVSRCGGEWREAGWICRRPTWTQIVTPIARGEVVTGDGWSGRALLSKFATALGSEGVVLDGNIRMRGESRNVQSAMQTRHVEK
ncbi:hypothetical protein IWX49DRAFT_585822 [Phyllosticta citricarpa]